MSARQADDGVGFSPFGRFSREEWCRLSGAAALALSEDDMRELPIGGVSLEETREVYLPLS